MSCAGALTLHASGRKDDARPRRPPFDHMQNVVQCGADRRSHDADPGRITPAADVSVRARATLPLPVSPAVSRKRVATGRRHRRLQDLDSNWNSPRFSYSVSVPSARTSMPSSGVVGKRSASVAKHHAADLRMLVTQTEIAVSGRRLLPAGHLARHPERRVRRLEQLSCERVQARNGEWTSPFTGGGSAGRNAAAPADHADQSRRTDPRSSTRVGAASCICRAASSVLRSSMVIVIGPDTARNRRNRFGDFGDFVESHVADQAVALWRRSDHPRG